MLTDEQITEFQKIYLQTFGREIDKKEAIIKGIQLVRLLQIIYKNLIIKK